MSEEKTQKFHHTIQDYLLNNGSNWNDGHICDAHWSAEDRKTYMICLIFQYQKINLKKYNKKLLLQKIF